MDNLQLCADRFKNLLNIQYKIVVGRKGKTKQINIDFDEAHFFHLVGLHKLKDIEFLRSGSSKHIYHKCLSNELTYEVIKKSVFFSEIKSRINIFIDIESYLDNNLVFGYSNKFNHSNIVADYLLSCDISGDIVYVFIEENKQNKIYFCKSFFPKTYTDYTLRQTRYTVLFKEKINKKTGESIIFINKLKP